MEKKAVSEIMLTMLLVGMMTLAFDIQPVKSEPGTIYIRADGSIDPPTAPITSIDNITYSFTGNIGEEIVVERSDIVINGSGFTLKGYESYSKMGNGFYLFSVTNVTITNMTIQAFEFAVYLNLSSHNVLSGNNIGSMNYLSANEYGIYLDGSSFNEIIGNNISSQYEPYMFSSECGICLSKNSNNNLISGNNITDTGHFGIQLLESLNNTVSHNEINFNFENGITTDGSSNDNEFSSNSLNSCGISVGGLRNLVSRNILASGSIRVGGSRNVISRNNGTHFGITLSYAFQNFVYENKVSGVNLGDSSGNTISRNNITQTSVGISVYSADNNTFSQNIIADNEEEGIDLYHSRNNVFWGNTVANNAKAGLQLIGASNDATYVQENVFYHNNLINNQPNIYIFYSTGNTWDNGYPSGGNHWSDYTGVDANGDGIGDTSYAITDQSTRATYEDQYPLMTPWAPLEHQIVASVTAPPSLQPGSSSRLNATVINEGSNDELNVELSLLIDGTIVNSITAPFLNSSTSESLSYVWTPMAEGTFNVTAYAHPVPGETRTEDNQVTKLVTVAVTPPQPVQIGVKTGDWIKVDYTIAGGSSGTPLPQWIKMEFLSIEGTTANLRVTMHMSDGTEPSQTITVDVSTGSGTFQGLSGFVIPANSKTGDSIYITGYGSVTIAGETTRIYVGASRTVVYASFSKLGTQLTYYWDKLTGVMVEASTTSGSVTATGKATETNMWQADSAPFWMQWWFYAMVAVVIVVVGGAVYFLRKRKPPARATPAEGT